MADQHTSINLHINADGNAEGAVKRVGDAAQEAAGKAQKLKSVLNQPDLESRTSARRARAYEPAGDPHDAGLKLEPDGGNAWRSRPTRHVDWTNPLASAGPRLKPLDRQANSPWASRNMPIARAADYDAKSHIVVEKSFGEEGKVGRTIAVIPVEIVKSCVLDIRGGGGGSGGSSSRSSSSAAAKSGNLHREHEDNPRGSWHNISRLGGVVSQSGGAAAELAGGTMSTVGSAGTAAAMGLGPVAIAAAAVAGGLMLMNVGMKQLGRTFEILNDSATTNAQKNTAIVREFAPMGNTFLNMAESVSGITNVIREAQRGLQTGVDRPSVGSNGGPRVNVSRSFQGIEGQFRIATQEAADERHVVNMRNRGGAAAAMPFSTAQYFDTHSYAGQLQQQAYQTMQPARDQQTLANRDVLTATQNRDLTRNQLSSADSDVVGARSAANRAYRVRQQFQDFQNNSSNPLSGSATSGTMAQVMAQEQRANVALTAALERQAAAAQANVQSEQQLLEARRNQIQSNQAVMRAEAEFARQRADRMTSNEQRWGSQNPAQRAMDDAAARQIRAAGSLDSFTPAMIEAGRRSDPRALERLERERGARDIGASLAPGQGFDRGNETNRGGGPDGESDYADGRTSAQARREDQEARQRVRVSVSLDEAALSTEMSNTIQTAMERVIQSVKAQLMARIQSIETQLQAGAAH